MKVFNLCCSGDHRFEGWFASADDYERQLGQGLVECPLCGDREVRKLLSAPRLNLSASKVSPSEAAAQAAATQAETKTAEEGKGGAARSGARGSAAASLTPRQMHEMWVQLARHLVDNTEDVGTNFAEEARRIHYQEAPERGIRGVADAEERAALEDEGIDVFTFPMPQAMKGPIQ